MQKTKTRLLEGAVTTGQKNSAAARQMTLESRLFKCYKTAYSAANVVPITPHDRSFMYYLYETGVGLSLYKVKDSKAKLVKAVVFGSPEEADAHQSLARITEPLQKIIEEVIHLQTKKNKTIKLQLSSQEVADFIRSEFGLKTKVTATVGERTQINQLIAACVVKDQANATMVDQNQVNLFTSSRLSRLQLKLTSESVDRLIIESLALYDQSSDEINLFNSRLSEWVQWSFPETVKLLQGRQLSQIHALIGGNNLFYSDSTETEYLHQLLDSTSPGLADQLVKIAKTSSGSKLQPADIDQIRKLAALIQDLYYQRDRVQMYIEARTARACPNLANLIGPLTAARMLGRAHSLVNLAKCSGSTLQIFGAEKSYFNRLKRRETQNDMQGREPERWPKYGFIYSIVQQAPEGERGGYARRLACKAAICARVDALSDKPIRYTPVVSQTRLDQEEVKRAKMAAFLRKQREEEDKAYGIIAKEETNTDIIQENQAPAKQELEQQVGPTAQTAEANMDAFFFTSNK